MFAQIPNFQPANGVYVPHQVILSSPANQSLFSHPITLSPGALPISAALTPATTAAPLLSMPRPPLPQQSLIPCEGPTQLRKLFIGGLHHDTTDEQLRNFYERWGQVVDCIVIRDPYSKQSRGFGFVTYASINMAEAAMNERPHTINEKTVDPKRAIPREEMLPLNANNRPYFLDQKVDSASKVLLANVHWDHHTVDTLRSYFEKFGSIDQVEIFGHPRGAGFIVFDDSLAADKCVAVKDHKINGRKCDVFMREEEAESKLDKLSGNDIPNDNSAKKEEKA